MISSKDADELGRARKLKDALDFAEALSDADETHVKIS